MVTRPEADTGFSLDFPRAGGEPACEAGFRVDPADFRVDENLGFVPEGAGEHLLVHLCKTGENTRWVAASLAAHFGVEETAVGYCGLKDRRAVASQWFSVHLPGRDASPPTALPGCELLGAARHPRKLRRGDHADNSFVIRLRFDAGAREDVEPRLRRIAAEGVPNYFGEQRFGIQGQNLGEVARIVARSRPRFRGRRGALYLSAARAWLFNQVLAERVVRGDWRDVRAADGPLWGRGRSPAPADQARDEERILAPWLNWCLALEHSGLKQERRDLVLTPGEFDWRWLPDSVLELSFALPPGTYATAVLRELALLRSPSPVPARCPVV